MRLVACLAAAAALCACDGKMATDTPDPFSYGEREAVDEPGTFRGYECQGDCEGHEAGFQWAEENDIRDEAECGGNSESFREGCVAWTEDNAPAEDPYDQSEIGLF